MKNISIIMPLFNAEKYLPEAIQSILNQKYQDFELICIDDCSTDNTKKILMNFQQKDKRISILSNKIRLGAALSRNNGLREAQGIYVTFLDGDDIFEEEMLEKAYCTIEKYEADIVIFERMHVPSNEIYTKRVINRPQYFWKKYCGKTFSVKDYEARNFPNWATSPGSKLYRRSFLISNKLEFQNLKSCNDGYFSKMSLFCAKKIVYLEDDRIMLYARDHSNASRISVSRDPMNEYYAMEKLAMELKKRNMFPEIAATFYYLLALYMMAVLTREKDEDCKKQFYDFLHYVGISECIRCGKEDYERVDSYDKYLLDNFLNSSYESGWFHSPESYFQFHLKRNGETVCSFIKDKMLKNKIVVVWGIGVNGTKFVRYLTEHFVKVTAIVDSDESKQGNIVEGYKIDKPDMVCGKADYIFVTSELLYWDVKDLGECAKSELINVLDILVNNDEGKYVG